MKLCFLVLAIVLSVSLIAQAHAQQFSWTKLETGEAPPARRSHAMAYDSDSDLIVVFGGFGNGSHLSDTWVLDVRTRTWKNMEPNNAPSPRAATTMVYDSISKQMILFGGFGLGHSVVSNETWTYDYAKNDWSLIETRAAPSERASYGMTLDSKRQELVLFGGFTELGYFNDVWIYDISAKEWTSSELSGKSPSPRGAMSFAYDVENDHFVMFGGFSDQGFFSDTWILDPNSNAWFEVEPENSPPPLRSRMVYDEAKKVSILFGGDTASSVGHQGAPMTYDKAWFYDSGAKSWAEIGATVGPEPRALNGIAYDPNSATTVIFGGTDTLIDNANFVGNEFQDTWTLASKETGNNFSIVLVAVALAAAIAIVVIARTRKTKTIAE